jgi:gas vesicle protein
MKTTLGLVAGIAVGVCIGLLVAPDKGSETRKKLADSAGDWLDKIKDLFGSSEEAAPSKLSSKRYQQSPGTTT